MKTVRTLSLAVALGAVAVASGGEPVARPPVGSPASGGTGAADSGRTLAALPVAPGCGLGKARADAARTDDCVSCHASGHAGADAHPVGVDYGGAAARSRGRLRAADQVVARGVFLPGGRLECVTCHDARSPWKSHLAIPPGTQARSAVDPRRRETWERSASAEALRAGAAPAGAAVTPTPLCVTCHAMD